MEILEIKNLDDATVYVQAIAEDFILDQAQTLYDPPDYRSAIVETFVDLETIRDYMECDIVSQDIISQYLECVDYDLDWKEVGDY
jgi:hypothetical protein